MGTEISEAELGNTGSAAVKPQAKSEVGSDIAALQQQIAALLLYQAVLADEVGQAFVNLLQELRQGTVEGCLTAYGHWFQALAAQRHSWTDHLIQRILLAENPFTDQAQRQSADRLSPNLLDAARHDLRILQQMYQCDGQQIGRWVQAIAPTAPQPIIWDPDSESATPGSADQTPDGQTLLLQATDWSQVAEELAAHYRQFGTGDFATFQAFRWQQGQLMGIACPDPIQLSQIAAYDYPRQRLIQNTEFLLAGYPALHVLLYGSRGSGKSSLVKALLNEYGDRGLRLIEVGKSELQDLTAIVDRLRDLPQKFIIFVDDLSFEEDDDAFKALKVVLEGNVTARPNNMVVYATSNRRHLIREFFADRPRPSDSDEIHNWDTVQEKLSFSDRFGLTLTFEPANQATYLNIVNHLAAQAGIDLEPEDLKFRALQWATRNNGRSGRTARQFVDFLRAELGI